MSKTTRQFTKTLKYDKVIDAAGNGDYTSIYTAVNTEPAGTSFYIRNGIYNETNTITMKDDMSLIGESERGVILDFGGGTHRLRANPSASDVTLDNDEASIDGMVTNGSKVVTSASATFQTNGITAGMYIVFFGHAYEIGSVDSETQLTLVEDYEGISDTTVDYHAGSFTKNLLITNMTVRNSTILTGMLTLGLSVRSCFKNLIVSDSTTRGVYIRNCASNYFHFRLVEYCPQRGVEVISNTQNMEWGNNIIIDQLINCGTFGFRCIDWNGMDLNIGIVETCDTGVQVDGGMNRITVDTIKNCASNGFNVTSSLRQSSITIGSIWNCDTGLQINNGFGGDAVIRVDSIMFCTNRGVYIAADVNNHVVILGSVRNCTNYGIEIAADSQTEKNTIIINGEMKLNGDGIRALGDSNKFVVNGSVIDNTNDDVLIDSSVGDDHIFSGAGKIGSFNITEAGSSNNRICGLEFDSITQLSPTSILVTCRMPKVTSKTSILTAPDTLDSGDVSQTIELDASSANVAVILRALASIGFGVRITFKKSGANDAIVQAYSGSVIADSGTSAYTTGTVTKGNAGQIYNETASETWATITLEYVATNTWVIVGAHGTWVTS
jgi:hypothetical protein